MKPLKPEDMLLRSTPVGTDRWSKSIDPNSGTQPNPIQLERFQELEQTIRNNPVSSAPYIELARIYLHQERWVDAKRVLDRAAELFSSDENVLFLREEAQLARSLQLLSHAEAEYRAEPTILTEKELTRSKLELNAIREKVCRARLERHPHQLELTIPLAEALEGLDRSSESIEYLQKAATEPGLRAAACLKLGEVLERTGRVTDALSAYRRAALFRAPPTTTAIQVAALTRAAELSFQTRMIDSAHRYIEMLQQIEPQNPRWPQMAQEVRELASALQP